MSTPARRPGLVLSLLVSVLLVAPSLFAGEGRIRRSQHAVKGEYIVVLADAIPRDEVPDVARRVAKAHGAVPAKIWQSALKGFVVTMPEGRAEALSRHPDVAFVEENAQVFLSGTGTIATNVDQATCNPWTTNCAATTDNRLWHLDRLGQTWAAPDHKATSCDAGTSVNVTVYVLDTGVKADHQEFLNANNTSRVVTTGYDATSEGPYFPAHDPCNGWPGDVPAEIGRISETSRYQGAVGNNGHGTGVASLVGGNRVGVANNVTIVPVKAMPCRYNAARAHRPSFSYQPGDFIWNSTGSGQPDRYWMALSGGTSGPGEGWTPPTVSVSSSYTDSDGITWRREADPPNPATQGIPTTANIADGLDWIRSATRNPFNSRTNAVVTMSMYALDTDASLSAMELAIEAVINAGIPVVASANNQSGDACNTSPARLSIGNPTQSLRKGVITVGGTMIRNNPDYQTGLPAEEAASGSNDGLEPGYVNTEWTRDARWICGAGDSDLCSNTPAILPPTPSNNNGYAGLTLGSNGGACVTLFAPAKNIPVASMKDVAADYRDPRRLAATASGTSWSTPIVTGVIARIIQNFPNSSVATIRQKLLDHTISGAIDPAGLDPTNVTGTPNVLLNHRDVLINTPPADATNSGSGVTLSVTANRSDVTYQWFQVNNGFDLANRTGAHSSVLLTGQTASTLNVNPTADTAYWVRVSTSCSQAESSIAKVTAAVAPAAPATFSATYSGGLLAFTWSAVSGATGYRIERKVPSAAWAQAFVISGGGTTSSNQTAPSAPDGVVLYRILALNGGVASGPGPSDLAYVNAFTDDPLVAGVTVIKGTHLTAIRGATNALCDILDVTRQYQPGELSITGQSVTAAQFMTTMSRLSTARQSASLSPVSYTVNPQAGAPVTTTSVNELRNGIR